MYWITAMPFLSCFISVVKEKSGELAASLPPDHPIFSICLLQIAGRIPVCVHSSSSVSRNPCNTELPEQRTWLDRLHTSSIHLLFYFGVRPSQLSYVIWADMFEMIFSFLVYIIAPSLVVFNKNNVNFLCKSHIAFVNIAHK